MCNQKWLKRLSFDEILSMIFDFYDIIVIKCLMKNFRTKLFIIFTIFMVTYFFLGTKEKNQLPEEKNKKIGILDSTSASIFSVRRKECTKFFSFEKC